jgi:hypothetical protein
VYKPVVEFIVPSLSDGEGKDDHVNPDGIGIGLPN